jgi:hypothetical protein
MIRDRLYIEDWNTYRQIQSQVQVGKAFAFVLRDIDLLEKVGDSIEDIKKQRQGLIKKHGKLQRGVHLLLGLEPIKLPGCVIEPTALPKMNLVSITSDKMLYRERTEAANILVLELGAANKVQEIEIWKNGANYARQSVTLDEQGMGSLLLRELREGQYDLRFKDFPDDSPVCNFTVAAYRLAPLVAILERRELEDHGQQDDGRRVTEIFAVAKAGAVEVSFPLEGDGPHSLQIQWLEEPSRTATIPLVGSRKAERLPTLFSPMGREIMGSLLPSSGSSTCVRGIYLDQTGVRTTPFRLDRIDTQRVRLHVDSAAEMVQIAMLDMQGMTEQNKDKNCLLSEQKDCEPASTHTTATDTTQKQWLKTWSFEQLKAGEELELDADTPIPCGLLAIGAFVNGRAWEGWAMIIAPSNIQLQIKLPRDLQAGTEIELQIQTALQSDKASAYIIVKDARLLNTDTPTSQLANQIKAFTAEMSDLLHIGEVKSYIGSMQSGLPIGGVGSMLGSSIWGHIPFDLNEHFGSGGSGGEHRLYGLQGYVGDIPGQTDASYLSSSSHDSGINVLGQADSDYHWLKPSDFINTPYVVGCRAGSSFEDLMATCGYNPDEEPAPENSQFPLIKAIDKSPEVLLARGLPLSNGSAQICLYLPDQSGDYIAEAFVLSSRDWDKVELRFEVRPDPTLSLDLPPFVHPSDTARGYVHIGASLGQMNLTLTHNGLPVTPVLNGKPLDSSQVINAQQAQLYFPVTAGHYEAVLKDLGSGEIRQCSADIDIPGKLVTEAITLHFLKVGETIARTNTNDDTDGVPDGVPDCIDFIPDDSPDCDLYTKREQIIELRILPGLKKPFRALVEATAGYEHLCCEQTAAKIISACAMYSFAEDESTRQIAESILIAGVHRLKDMWLPQQGFKMYPTSQGPNEYYGEKTSQYLRYAVPLRDNDQISSGLRDILDLAHEMAEDSGRAYALTWPPTRITNSESAYTILRFHDDPDLQTEALNYVRETAIRFTPADLEQMSSLYPLGKVGIRANMAYLAASLLYCKQSSDLPPALELTNYVTAALGENGQLYSTVDSVAAISLFRELEALGLNNSAGQIAVDGQMLSLLQAQDLQTNPRQIQCLEGIALVEVKRLIVEDWHSLATNLQIRVALEKDGIPIAQAKPGDAFDLVVTIENGYSPGDLLWVCLPDVLSYIANGGQLKRFAIDFQEQSTLRIPIAATNPTLDQYGHTAPQHFAVCVRNMFEEERVGNPGLLQIIVENS